MSGRPRGSAQLVWLPSSVTCQVQGLDQAIGAKVVIAFADVYGVGAVRQAPRLVRGCEGPGVPSDLGSAGLELC